MMLDLIALMSGIGPTADHRVGKVAARGRGVAFWGSSVTHPLNCHRGWHSPFAHSRWHFALGEVHLQSIRRELAGFIFLGLKVGRGMLPCAHPVAKGLYRRIGMLTACGLRADATVRRQAQLGFKRRLQSHGSLP